MGEMDGVLFVMILVACVGSAVLLPLLCMEERITRMMGMGQQEGGLAPAPLPGSSPGCRTEYCEKLSSSQAQPGQKNKLRLLHGFHPFPVRHSEHKPGKGCFRAI